MYKLILLILLIQICDSFSAVLINKLFDDNDFKYKVLDKEVPEDISTEPHIFKTLRLPDNERLLPITANGHLGYTLTSDTIYMNGLYNGQGGRSHRARISAHTRCKPIMDTNHTGHYELDVKRGLYKSVMRSREYIYEEFVYAHKYYTRALIHHIRIRSIVNRTLSINMKCDPGPTSQDIRFNMTKVHSSPYARIYSECGETSLVENKTYQQQLTPICVYWVNVTDVVEVPPLDVVDVLMVQSMDNKDSVAQKEILDVLNNGHRKLLTMHTKEWDYVWNEALILIEGDLSLSKIIYASLYYTLSSLPSTNTNQKPAQFYGLSPGSLARGSEVLDYEGHNFWDTEIWMFPVILMLYPDLAQTLLNYRASKKGVAKVLANETGCKGYRFPWESAYTGYETTQPCCPEVAKYQLHVTADVAFALRQYLAVKGYDDSWIQEHGCDLMLGIADFWASRTVFNTSTLKYDINNVMGPDEDHYNINNSVYTNVAAGLALHLGQYAQCICRNDTKTNYTEIAQHLTLLYDASKDYHPEFQGFDPERTKIKQADVVLLGYPLLYQHINRSTRIKDLSIYGPITRTTGPAMTWAMHSINYLQLGFDTEGQHFFEESYKNYVREPFKIWNENRNNDGAVNFLTGMGGFLQNIVNGFCFITIDLQGLHFKRFNSTDGFNVLPKNVTSIYIKGLKFHGTSFEVRVTKGFTVLRAMKVNEDKPLRILETGQQVLAGKTVRVTTAVTISPVDKSSCNIPSDIIGQ